MITRGYLLSLFDLSIQEDCLPELSIEVIEKPERAEIRLLDEDTIFVINNSSAEQARVNVTAKLIGQEVSVVLTFRFTKIKVADQFPAKITLIQDCEGITQPVDIPFEGNLESSSCQSLDYNPRTKVYSLSSS